MGTGNNVVSKDLMINAPEGSPTIAPSRLSATQAIAQTGMAQQTPLCLRDNECSQQQLVRLVGYRSPAAASGAWDRRRLEQAQGAS